MAVSEKKLMQLRSLGVFMATLMAILLFAATEGAVMVANPARIPAVDVLVDGESLHVGNGVLSIDMTEAEQILNFTISDGRTLSIGVKDGEFVMLLPQALLGDNAPASVRVAPVPGPGFDRFSLPAGEPRVQP